MSKQKILAAASGCLKAAAHGYGDYPFARVRAYLYTLRADPDWTDADVMDVQMRVIQLLLSQNARTLCEAMPFHAQ